MKTIEELRKSISTERKKLKTEQTKKSMEITKRKLKKELFTLQHRIPITLGQKGVKLIRKKAKQIAPIIKKQGKLIRDQQLRDEAIQRKLKKIKKPIKKKQSSLGIFEPLDF